LRVWLLHLYTLLVHQHFSLEPEYELDLSGSLHTRLEPRAQESCQAEPREAKEHTAGEIRPPQDPGRDAPAARKIRADGAALAADGDRAPENLVFMDRRAVAGQGIPARDELPTAFAQEIVGYEEKAARCQFSTVGAVYDRPFGRIHLLLFDSRWAKWL
jgi:hypothetical protein